MPSLVTMSGQPLNASLPHMNWDCLICQQLILPMLMIMSHLFASSTVISSTSCLPTQAPVVQMQNVCADKMTSVPKFLVERARGTVMMTLNVKGHLFVDT